MNYIKDKGFYVSEPRVIAYGPREIILKSFHIEKDIEPISKIFVSNKDLVNLKKKGKWYIQISEGCYDLDLLLKIGLDFYKIYLYYEAYPICIKYYKHFFILAPIEEPNHEMAIELQSTIKIKKLSDY